MSEKLSGVPGKEKNTDLPFGLYFWTPLLLASSPYALQLVFGEARWLSGERGIFEILTFLFLIVAIYFILRARFFAVALRISHLPAWLIVLLLGGVYFAGEEISWGQHFFLWQTPDAWQGINEQSETNLHNVHALFDQLPRALLTLAALIGGVLLPLYRYWRGVASMVGEAAGWLWPTGVCTPVCVLVLVITPFDGLIERLGDAVPAELNISGGEMKECLLALFILFYAMSLFRRLKVSDSGGV